MKTRYRRQPLAAATTLFLMALATPVAAQSVWTGAVSDQWLDAGNWEGGVPPNGSNEVQINSNTPAPVIDGIAAVVNGPIQIGYSFQATEDAGLTIRNSGTLTSAGSSEIGRNTKQATTTVEGGSTWTNDGYITIGSYGNGTLNIFAGSKVNDAGAVIGSQVGSTGIVNVDGPQSLWTTSASLSVGGAGSGVLNVTNRGEVKSDRGSVTSFNDASSVATVDGAGSSWRTVGGLTVGVFEGGVATLNVHNGGRIEGRINAIGRYAGSSGLVSIDGPGSIWAGAIRIDAGDEGNGTLNITNKGKVEVENVYIGKVADSIGSVTVDDAEFMLEELNVADAGNGALHILNGGVAEVTGDACFGCRNGATGLVEISGAGSYLDIGGQLQMGALFDAPGIDGGDGQLRILDGGKLSVAGETWLGRESVGGGQILVDGAGSTLDVSNIVIGPQGTGLLTLSNGGSIDAGDVTVGQNGLLVIGGGQADPAQAPGVFNGNNLTLAGGSLIFNHIGNADGTGLVFSADIGGAGYSGGALLHYGPGTTILTGNSTYTGSTVVRDGELRVDGSLSGTSVLVTGEVSLLADHSPTLSGAGSIAGEVEVDLATLSGKQGQTLTMGALKLSDDATVAAALGAPASGGATLFDVLGDITLDGTLSVSDLGGFGTGVYRLFDYGGTLTDEGLEIGTTPAGIPASDLTVQTAVDHQVNLISLGGQTLSFWDGGDESLHNNASVDGGDGVWLASGSSNWTTADGQANGDQLPQPGFAVFQGTAGTVTVDASAGAVEATGLQFASDGYRLDGDALTLTEAQNVIRVGDGSAASSAYIATIANELTGAGALVKTDLGTLVLAGENSYAGGTVIRDGTLQVGDGDVSGSITGDVINDGVLAFNRLDTVTYAGTISGSGVLRTSYGITKLTGENTYTGTSIIGSGLLMLGDGGTSGSIKSNVINHGGLAFNRSDETSFGGVISGEGTVLQFGEGSTTLTGNNTYTGRTDILHGTLQLGDGGTTGSIVSDVSNEGTLAFNRSDNVAYAGVISNSGAVQQHGAGAVVLTGANTYTGATTVAAGTLSVNGSIASSSLTTVAAGGRLSGTGTVGNTAVQGTIAPGNSIGTLKVQGNYTQVAGSTYEVEIDPSGASDRLDITGTAALNGTVFVNKAAGSYLPGTSYTILTAAGGITGGYTALLQNLPFVNLDFSRTANQISLDVVRNTVAFCDVAASANQCATGRGAQSLGSGGVYNAIVGLRDTASAQAAFDALSGEIHASTRGALREQSSDLRNATAQRDSHKAGGFWTQGLGAWGHVRGDGNAARMETDRTGLLLGADWAIGEGGYVGVAGGYGKGSVKVDERRSSVDIDTLQAGLYGGVAAGRFGLDAGIGYARHSLDGQRDVTFAGFNDHLKADYDATTLQAYLRGTVQVNEAISGFIEAASVDVKTDGFRERGGAAALTVHDDSTKATYGTVGVRLDLPTQSGPKLHGSLGWRQRFGGDDQTQVTEQFQGGQPFTVLGAQTERKAFVGDIGLDWALGKNSQLSVSYAGTAGGGEADNRLDALFSIKF